MSTSKTPQIFLPFLVLLDTCTQKNQVQSWTTLRIQFLGTMEDLEVSKYASILYICVIFDYSFMVMYHVRCSFYSLASFFNRLTSANYFRQQNTRTLFQQWEMSTFHAIKQSQLPGRRFLGKTKLQHIYLCRSLSCLMIGEVSFIQVLVSTSRKLQKSCTRRNSNSKKIHSRELNILTITT